MSKILVTGACGGIGSRLIPTLLENGHEILAVDNLYSGVWENLNNHVNLTPITLDISDEVQVLDILGKYEFEFCIHLAAISSLPECQSEPTRALKVNFLGTQVIAELCSRQRDFKQFIFASTSAVYEGIGNDVLTEDLALSPVLVYPQSKYFSERLLNSMNLTRGFPVVILRLFNVFGDRQNILRKSPPLINYLVRELASNRAPKLYGWNAPGRDYVSVNTVNQIILKLLGNQKSFGRTLNVCSGETLNVKEIYAIVAKSLNSNILPELQAPSNLWSSYPEIENGNFPLSSKFVEAETNKAALGSPKEILDLIGESLVHDTRNQISATAISILAHFKDQNK